MTLTRTALNDLRELLHGDLLATWFARSNTVALIDAGYARSIDRPAPKPMRGVRTFLTITDAGRELLAAEARRAG